MSDVTAGDLRHKRQLGMLPHKTGDGSKQRKNSVSVMVGLLLSIYVRVELAAVRSVASFREFPLRNNEMFCSYR